MLTIEELRAKEFLLRQEWEKAEQKAKASRKKIVNTQPLANDSPLPEAPFASRDELSVAMRDEQERREKERQWAQAFDRLIRAYREKL